MTELRFEVQDRPNESRYVLLDLGEDGTGSHEAGEESYVDFQAENGSHRVLFHTGVNEEYGGQGLASVLVKSAVDSSIAAGHAIVPVCSYVAAWLKKHPEYDDHVVKPRPEHLRAISERKIK